MAIRETTYGVRLQQLGLSMAGTFVAALKRCASFAMQRARISHDDAMPVVTRSACKGLLSRLKTPARAGRATARACDHPIVRSTIDQRLGRSSLSAVTGVVRFRK